jgi:hypothetical protein
MVAEIFSADDERFPIGRASAPKETFVNQYDVKTLDQELGEKNLKMKLYTI